MADLDQYREKVVKLLRYLEEYVKLRGASAILDVAKYADDGLLLWFHELPKTKVIVCQAWPDATDEQTDLWLRVPKQDLPPYPALPNDLEPWVELAEVQRSGGAEPQLRPIAYLPVPPPGSEKPEQQPEEAAEEGEETQPKVWQHRIEDHPELQKVWQRYLVGWRPWSEEHARKAAIQRVYASLYSAYQKQKRFGEAYELVVGLGLLNHQQQRGQRVRRHVLAAQAEVEFDSKKGVISLRCPPPPDGARVQAEDEFLDPEQRPLPEAYEALREQLRLLGDAIWDRTQIDSILRGWANSIPPAPSPQYAEMLTPPRDVSAGPILSFSPALILRRRTARGTLALYKRLIAAVEGGAPVPFGLARLVEHLEDESPTAEHQEGATSQPGTENEPEEPYFPLPSNDQQLAIVRQIQQSRGVLVQGPPGTGKSQTIANLICHLLAVGRRVLVTAETARALAVLKKKIPKEVQPLCVSLLGADEASFAELNAAVTGISNRHAQWNDETKAASEKHIFALAQDLNERKTKRAELQRQRREYREAETREVTIGDGAYRGTAATIAKRVTAERAAYDWLALVDSARPEPAVSNAEASELLGLLREFPGASAGEAGQSLVQLDQLPTPEEFQQSVAAEKVAQTKAESYRHVIDNPSLRGLLSSPAERREVLRAAWQSFVNGHDALAHRPEPWLGGAVREILTGRDKAWSARAEFTRAAVGKLRRMSTEVGRIHLEIPAGLSDDQVLNDARVVLKHLRDGGRWSLLGFHPRCVKGREYLRKNLRVEGAGASSPERLEKVILTLEARRVAADAETRWPNVAASRSAPLETRIAELEENLEATDLAFDLLKRAKVVGGQLGALQPPVPLPDWSPGSVAMLLEALEAAEAVDAAERASRLFKVVENVLNQAVAVRGSHHVHRSLLDHLVGRNTQRWSEAYLLAQILAQKQGRYARLMQYSGRLVPNAPLLWERLLVNPFDPAWDQKLECFEQAWRWVVADRWLETRRDPTALSKLDTEITVCDKRIAAVLTDLAAEKAWRFFLTRLTTKQRENLVAWKGFIKDIGKGTGKTASIPRAAAIKSMTACVDAIPIWIMPRYRVSEVFDPKPDLFDFVIVDEASQMGVEGLCLYGLAKHVVVVGDAEQISPAGVGVPVAAVSALAAQFLQDIPFPEAFGPRASIYRHAEIHFKRRTVLREHFRCMPEIIGFSDQLCYAPNGTPLVPLRTYEPSRLEPVVTRFIHEGFQEGSASNAVNRPEAQALANQILACVRDPRYKAKTFGVISLLGEAQARLIERLLLSTLGPEEMEARQLVCGDAYAFQGDERDVVFLSMVSAPNARIGALTREDAFQRFNVAGSRARDQLWLFHSAGLEDLSATCVRRRLLQYCLNPHPDDAEETPTFDSDFERHVYEVIRAKGYSVRTQVAGGDQTTLEYRIDLVVQGERARLAVECDGDEWHGPERYEQDMFRQRQLERVGWIFFRISESDFYRNREASLEPLWRNLDRLGIDPTGGHPSRTPPPLPSEDVNATDVLDADVGIIPAETPPGEGVPPPELLAVVGPISEADMKRPLEGPIPSVQGPDISPAPEEGTAPPLEGPFELPSVYLRVEIPDVPVGAGLPGGPSAPLTPSPSAPGIVQSERPTPIGDQKLLRYFESVPPADWADLAQWARYKSPWDATRRNFILRISKSVAVGKSIAESEQIWAARLHSLACRIGFRPHPPGAPGGEPSGQARLPFDAEKVH